MKVQTPNQSPSWSSILSGVDETIKKIGTILSSSSKAKSEFQEKWTSLIDEFDNDIANLDNELAKFPPSWSLYVEMKEKERGEERRRKRTTPSETAKSCSSHALNYHMKAEVEKDEIFMLPPEPTISKDDEMTSSSNLNRKNSIAAKGLSREQRHKIEEERKFNMREKIFVKMEELRSTEMKAIEQLESPLETESKEQSDNVKSVEQVQQHSSNQMLKLIAQYKPQAKCNRKAKDKNILAMSSRNQGYKKNKKLGREKKMINDTNNYCSIENLPISTTIGESSSLKRLVMEATNNVNEKVLHTPLGKTDDSTNNDGTIYSNFDFESDEDEYGSDDFE